MDTEGHRVSSSDIEADRLARVKLSCTIEPGDPRVTGLVSELGATKVLGYLEAAADLDAHGAFSLGHELAHVDPGRVLAQAAARGIRFLAPGDAKWGLYERTDPGPHRIVLRPRRPAYFSIGTATAYQGGLHPITLTRLTVVLPGTHVRKTLSINLLASRPARGKIPVGITAITASPHS